MTPASPRSGLLIIRAERAGGGAPRIRITQVVERQEMPVVAVTDPDEACRVVRRCLEEILGPDPPEIDNSGDGEVTPGP